MEIDSGGYTQLTSKQKEAFRAEREAQERITQAHKKVIETQKESEQRLSSIKDEYQRREVSEALKHENKLESEKHKSYEILKNIKVKSDAEERKILLEAERGSEKIKNYSDNTIQEEEHRQKQRLNQVFSEHARSLDYFNQTTKQERDLELQDHIKQMDMARFDHEISTQKLSENNKKNIKTLQNKVQESETRAKDLFDHRYQETLKNFEESLNNLQNKTTEQIKKIKSDYSQKALQYENRSKDPFYSLGYISSSFHERDDAFILKAKVPPHEEKNVRVTVRGNAVVLSSARKNEENITIAPGKTQSSTAFQTTSESFPIDWPIDGKLMSRYYDGETLTIVLPKKNRNNTPELNRQKPADKLKTEKPIFPQLEITARQPSINNET